jgi:hypothetical protein
MSKRSSVYTCAVTTVIAMLLAPSARAADIPVPAGGNLQVALNAARPGDTILLAAGATYVGNFTLPAHGGTAYVTIRTGGNDTLLPASGARISPAHAPYLAKLRSPNSQPALRTAPRAAYWRVMLLEVLATQNGMYDIVQLGDGSPLQNSLSLVPQHLIVDRVYIHGDRLVGQKRGISLNSGDTRIINCHISDIKAVAQDSQAIAGANGPGPFHIENNYLEAAGEMFIIGGDDPKIPGLVPADLTFRGNTVTRPVSWRNSIVSLPPGVSASAASGGTLAAGTYGYRVVARRPAGTTTATSLPSAEITATVAAGGKVTIGWNAVQDAAEYRVYGRTPGGPSMYWTVTTTSFTDTGAPGTAGTPPSSATVWQVKNLFELKNLRRAQIDHNVMENNWLAAQNGIAVLFTPRNQNGGCPYCVVEDITFEYNVVRNVGGGINILGFDNLQPSQQTNNIRIRHNQFSGIDRMWGGTGYFLYLSGNPRDIIVDHNTIISPNGNGIVAASGPAMYGFVFTNNVARHNSYGIFGSAKGYGNAAISYYFPNGVIRNNVLAGGKASMYPAGNLFPTTSAFEAHFVDYAAGNYALQPGTDWAGAGTDAVDLGAGGAQPMAQNVPVPPPPQVVPPPPPSQVVLPPPPPPVVTQPVSNALPSVTLAATHSGVVPAGASVTLTAHAADSDGTVARVEFFINGQPAGSDTSAPFTLTWVARDGGPYAFRATATDNGGATATAALDLLTSAEIVIYASDVTRIVGDFQLVADATAANGRRLWIPNRNRPKILWAVAAPANYAEFTFYAEKGRPYRLWIRGNGERNYWGNDSAHLQFSGTVDAKGTPVNRIGTISAMWYSVEEYGNAGIMKWGWQDNGYGKNVVGPSLYFDRTGPQTIRIQQREDGLSIDQIVISPARYVSMAPGLPKNDVTIVTR